jgi:ABC-type glycerol-3-phosphate transport system substrate-binding protein
LRIATIPQEEIEPKKQTNLAKYTYFALTKDGKNRDKKDGKNDPAIKFVQFLLTKEAQNIFLKNITYSLPAQTIDLTENKDLKINPADTDFNMTINDWYVPTQTFVLYDMGIPHLFRAILKQAMGEPGTTATTVSGEISAYLTCKIGQLTDPATYSNACLCRTTLPINRNNYWPLCGQE